MRIALWYAVSHPARAATVTAREKTGTVDSWIPEHLLPATLPDPARLSDPAGAPAAAASCHSSPLAPPLALRCFPSYPLRSAQSPSGSPYLLGNVFSVLPEDSAPNQDLAGKETCRVSGPAGAPAAGGRE